MYDIIQNNFFRDFGLSKIVLHVYVYGPIKKQMYHKTSFLQHFHWKVFVMIVFDKHLGRISKIKKFNFGSTENVQIDLFCVP